MFVYLCNFYAFMMLQGKLFHHLNFKVDHSVHCVHSGTLMLRNKTRDFFDLKPYYLCWSPCLIDVYGLVQIVCIFAVLDLQ